MEDPRGNRPRQWAHLRHSVIGHLLASPPPRGELQAELARLAQKRWQHPVTGEWITFSESSIERWFYKAREAVDPIAALTRKVRVDAGRERATGPQLLAALRQQYLDYRRWSYKLHADNLRALCELEPEYGLAPSYATVVRRMQERGWVPRRCPARPTKGQLAAQDRLDSREVRSYEATHVHGLWHLDFHVGSRRVIDAAGRWHTPALFAALDDRSRLCCHIQWYLTENAHNLFHGLMQAFHKRGLPRALMHDNGAAMRAAETVNGLADNGITAQPTLAYSPYQNGKQECFWTQIEGRLLPMLQHVDPMRLDMLNVTTLAWAEQEYNRTRHDELGCSPLERYLVGPTVKRSAPSTAALRQSFAVRAHRTQRRSDGTISICGVRFELPSRLRVLRRPQLRFQRWDLSVAQVTCERTDTLLARIYPLDKEKNADRRRRALVPLTPEPPVAKVAPPTEPLPPLIRKYLADYAATGLPPAYLPKDEVVLDAATGSPGPEVRVDG